MKYIKRKHNKTIKNFLKDNTSYKNVLLVEGARQVGKTCLIENILESHKGIKHIFNLERDKLFLSLINDCKDFGEFQELLEDEFYFKPDKGHVLFIDEAQESGKLGGFVRFMKEEWKKATVILSGSSMTRLFRGDTRYPVGRINRLTVRPFHFSEYLLAQGKDELAKVVCNKNKKISLRRHSSLVSSLDHFLMTGGLPEIVLMHAQGENYKHRLAEIVADYRQDFVRLLGESNSGIAQSCLTAVANFAGCPFNNTNVIKNPSSQENVKINETLNRLENWHMIICSKQFGPGTEASHSYHPKRYLFDTGILRHFRETALPSLSILPDLSANMRHVLGAVIENQTALELIEPNQELCGWKRSSSGQEIDFIFSWNNEKIPVECKATMSINMRHLKGLIGYLEEYSVPLGIIVSLAPFEVIELNNKAKVLNIPLYMLETLPEIIETEIKK